MAKDRDLEHVVFDINLIYVYKVIMSVVESQVIMGVGSKGLPYKNSLDRICEKDSDRRLYD